GLGRGQTFRARRGTCTGSTHGRHRTTEGEQAERTEAERAEDERGDDGAHPLREVAQLEGGGAADRALVEVRLDPRRPATRKTAARVRPELLVDRPAVVRDASSGEVGLQVGLAQP